MQFIPTPGHTIDHFSVLVGRAGDDVLITGDMIHSPLQGKYPELGMMADYNSTQAGETRRKIFDRFCEEHHPVRAAIFPSPRRAACGAGATATNSSPWAVDAAGLPRRSTSSHRRSALPP